MHELIQRIVDQAGISEDAATRAADAVLAFVKERAPAPVAAQLETYLTGHSAASAVGAAAGALGGMVGKRGED